MPDNFFPPQVRPSIWAEMRKPKAARASSAPPGRYYRQGNKVFEGTPPAAAPGPAIAPSPLASILKRQAPGMAPVGPTAVAAPAPMTAPSPSPLARVLAPELAEPNRNPAAARTQLPANPAGGQTPGWQQIEQIRALARGTGLGLQTGSVAAPSAVPQAAGAQLNPAAAYRDTLQAAIGSNTPGMGLQTNTQAAATAANGYMPRKTVGGAWGQTHGEPVANEGNANRLAILTGAINRRNTRAAEAQAGAAVAGNAASDRAGANVDTSRVTYDPATNVLRGNPQPEVPASPGRVSDDAMAGRRAFTADRREATLAPRLAAVIERGKAEGAARRARVEARKTPPTIEQMLAMRNPAYAATLAKVQGDRDIAGQEMGGRERIATIMANAQRDVAKANADVSSLDRAHELAVKSGDRENAGKLQQALLDAQERMNTAKVNAEQATAKVEGERNLLRDVIAGRAAGLTQDEIDEARASQGNGPKTLRDVLRGGQPVAPHQAERRLETNAPAGTPQQIQELADEFAQSPSWQSPSAAYGNIARLSERLRELEAQGVLSAQNRGDIGALLRSKSSKAFIDAVGGTRDYYGAEDPNATYLRDVMGLPRRPLTKEEVATYTRRRRKHESVSPLVRFFESGSTAARSPLLPLQQ